MHKIEMAKVFLFAKKRKEHSGRLTRVQIPATANFVCLKVLVFLAKCNDSVGVYCKVYQILHGRDGAEFSAAFLPYFQTSATGKDRSSFIHKLIHHLPYVKLAVTNLLGFDTSS